jgi:DNA-binding LytR/AlgR family response regulator
VKFHDIDPQSSELWLRTYLPEEAITGLQGKPLGLYLMGKTASSVYLNGQMIGKNGQPSDNKKTEVVGKMDHIFYLPKEALKAQKNELIIHLSAHNGYIDLSSPMHFIALATYGDSKRFIQSHSNLGLIFVGMFVLSSLYYGSLALRLDNKRNPFLLFLMSFFAGSQLAVEISRGLVNYEYPSHDLRLISVCLFALGFGLSLLTLLCNKFAGTQKLHWIYGGALFTSIIVLMTPGFDIKTNLAIVVPILTSFVLITVNIKRQFSWNAVKYLAVLAVFICTVLATFRYFHELVFYFIVAMLLAYLFVQQANEYSMELESTQVEKALRAKLEFKLEQMQQHKKSETLNINSAGKVEKIATQDIFYCQASGDYVEIYLQSKELLFSGSLKSMTEQLPNIFIRVHRSYVVNIDKVKSLKRDGENGYLILSNDAQVPVSRRMMPQVRETFSAH